MESKFQNNNKFDMKIHNYKLSFFVDRALPKTLKLIRVKLIFNQNIVKIRNIRMTIYYNCPYLVNFTGVASLKQLPNLTSIIKRMNKKIKVTKIRIDSMFLSRQGNYRGNQAFNYNTIFNIAKSLGAQVECTAELFPVVNVTFPHLPTIRLFTTTSAQSLGVKTIQEIQELNLKVNKIFTLCLSTREKQNC